MFREETVSTLKFGQLCKSIKNSVKSNEIVDDKTIIRYEIINRGGKKEQNNNLTFFI